MDKRVDKNEFILMYKRCIFDETGLEPKSLYNMVQFLMYCKEGKYTITEEDTLELIFVRKGKELLTDEVEAIFGYLSTHKF